MTTETMLKELEYAQQVDIKAEMADNEEMRADAEYLALQFLRDHGPALVEAVLDAARYRAIRAWHDAKVGKKTATVVMWGDEPWEPSTAEALDQAIDQARSEGGV